MIEKIKVAILAIFALSSLFFSIAGIKNSLSNYNDSLYVAEKAQNNALRLSKLESDVSSSTGRIDRIEAKLFPKKR